MGAAWRALAFHSPPRRGKLPVRGGSLTGTCFSQPPEKRKTSCSWGCLTSSCFSQPPEKEKTTCSLGCLASSCFSQPPEKGKTSDSWGSLDWQLLFAAPPKKEKLPVRGAACTRSVERVQINQNAEVVPEKGTPPAPEQQNLIIWWKMLK